MTPAPGAARGRPTVIGLGNTFAHDDGIGPAVVAALADDADLDAHLVELDGEPARVIETWSGTPLTIVIDACCSGAPPGTVLRLEGADLAEGGRLQASGRRPSSHALGVAEALELGRALGRLPRRLVVLAVEAHDLTPGPGLSSAVAAALHAVADAVRQELRAVEARRIEVRGVVQGVGYRPFVWRLAARAGICGWVRNNGGRVEIHAEGAVGALEAFSAALVAEAPPLAEVHEVTDTLVGVTGAVGFTVAPSTCTDVDAGGRQLPPDSAPCPACLAELFDAGDRRGGHAFVSCTDCGPRATIIDALPYDRTRTSMAELPLCEACANDYATPADRRFHAETVACPSCGPTLRLVDGSGADRASGADPIETAAELLLAGAVVAVKGVGGYQLACDATSAPAVTELRHRKQRPDKPLAVLVADLGAARRLGAVGDDEAELLSSPAAPIVLIDSTGGLPEAVAPGHRRVGVMLPASPLHHLLSRAVGRPLVLTSGNRSDEPIAVDDDEALRSLAGIADAWLTHDRRIVTRLDDSVVAVRRAGPVVLRRARGYAPRPLPLAAALPRAVLAVGADLGSAFCLAAGREAFVSAHVGDLDDDATIAAWRHSLDRQIRLIGIRPDVVAHDAHPDLQSTRLAERLAAELGLPRVAVRHHHAHVAAVMAEHGLIGPVLGVAFDGYGLGDDGTAWGGELLVADASGYRRAGHLAPVPQPGGDHAVRHPVGMALAHAAGAGCLGPALDSLALEPSASTPLLGGVDATRLLAGAAANPAARTSSVGRLFDAVAALCGLGHAPTYEGQPAMLLEQLAAGAPASGPPLAAFGLHDPAASGGDGALVIDPAPVVRAVVAALAGGRPPSEVAAGFHAAVADAVVEAVQRLAPRAAVHDVCLAGGVWANGRLVDLVVPGLLRHGWRVHLARAVPPGDGGLSLGQALVAGSVAPEVS